MLSRVASHRTSIILRVAVISVFIGVTCTARNLPILFFGFFCKKDSNTYRIPSLEKIGSALQGSNPAGGRQSTAWDVLDVSTVRGRTALITGPNSGIGYHTALALAYGGATVLLACRDLKKGQAAKDSMQTELRNAGKAFDNIELVELDLASLASIHSFVTRFKSEGRPLNLLCLNAGVMAIPKYQQSVDGFEMQFATNHLGHFALTKGLLGTLAASSPSRVVVLSSEAHRSPSIAFNFDNFPPSSKEYSDWTAYQQSKLANVLFTVELAKRVKSLDGGAQVAANAVHPGVIATALGRQQLLKGQALLGILQDRNEVQGAATSVYCLTAKAVEGVTGGYFRDCKQVEPSRFASDPVAATRLWDLSDQLLKDRGFDF